MPRSPRFRGDLRAKRLIGFVFMYAAGSDEDSEEEEQEEDAEMAAAGERLNEVYERLQEVGSATAEARAAKILHGLGAQNMV